MGAGNIGFIITYVVIFAFIAAIPALGGDDLLGGQTTSAVPHLNEEGLTILNFIPWVFSWIIYLFAFQGLTIYAIPAVWAGLFGLGMNVGLGWAIAELVRGV